MYTLKSILLLALLLGASPLSPAPQPERLARGEGTVSAFLPNLTEMTLPLVEVAPDADLTFRLALTLPEGYHLNAGAPSEFALELPAEWGGRKQMKIEQIESAIEFKAPSALEGALSLRSTAAIYYCAETNRGICIVKSFGFNVPLRINEGAPAHQLISLPARLEAPKVS